MPVSWKSLNITKFYGLNLKTNPLVVNDGQSLGMLNCFQNRRGVVSKRKGNDYMFTTEAHSGTAAYEIDEIGHALINGTDYYFRFVNGDFEYATSIQGAITNISPTPAISTANRIWWVLLDNKIFFVDGTNVLRFFDPAISTSAVFTAEVYDRSVTAPTVGVGGGFDFVFTVEKGFDANNTSAEPGVSLNVGGASGTTVTVPASYTDTTGGTVNIATHDRIRIYSRSQATPSAYKNVTPIAGAIANGVYGIGEDGGGYLRVTAAGPWTITSLAITDAQPNLYTDLGVAINKQAPTALTGIVTHYGRLVGWKDDSVYNSKSSNPFAWPDDAANKEAFVYTIGEGDNEDIQRCISFQEGLYVGKQTQLFVFGGIGPDDTGNNAYSFRRIETNGIGIIAPKSVVVVGEESQNFLVFLSQQGFYATDGNKPVRVGELIESEVQELSTLVLSRAVGYHDKREGLYVCFVGTAPNRFGWVLDTRKDEGEVSGWYKWGDLNVKCVYYNINRVLMGHYNGLCTFERQAQTLADYKDTNVDYIDDTNVDATANTITIAAHGFSTGDPIRIRVIGAAVMPNPLVANTLYYVIVVDANTFRLATSEANALAGTAIDLTTTGTGDFSVVSYVAISAFYTTNWFNFGNAHVVKKLGKLGVSFNAAASSVNVTLDIAYNWNDSFGDTTVVAITGTHLWGIGPAWGGFVWAAGSVAVPKSVAIPSRKVRSIRYKFTNNVLEENLDLQGVDMPYAFIRNRNNFS